MSENDRPGATVLDRFFNRFERGAKLLIITHDHPDPDSISSAAALREIATVLGKAKTTVAYGGIIGRAENAHMVKYLKLKLRPIDRIKVSDYQYVALVDTQPRTGNNSLPPNRIPDVVIDHHPTIAPTRKVPFADIRLAYGATATILTEYLFHFGLEVDRNLATALLYGIKSETQDLGRETYQVDVDSYLKLFPLANKRLLAKIVRSRVSQTYFRWVRNAIQQAEVIDNAIVTQIGEVDNPDIVPEVADMLLRMQRTSWTLCQGEYKDALYLSIRTTNTRAHAGRMMKRLVRGKGTGGGHSLIAGGKIAVKEMEAWQVHELVTKLENDFLKMIRRESRPRVPLIDDAENGGKKGKSRSLVLVRP